MLPTTPFVPYATQSASVLVLIVEPLSLPPRLRLRDSRGQPPHRGRDRTPIREVDPGEEASVHGDGVLDRELREGEAREEQPGLGLLRRLDARSCESQPIAYATAPGEPPPSRQLSIDALDGRDRPAHPQPRIDVGRCDQRIERHDDRREHELPRAEEQRADRIDRRNPVDVPCVCAPRGDAAPSDTDRPWR
ncbi:unnamed protein product [Penicillium discolor]